MVGFTTISQQFYEQESPRYLTRVTFSCPGNIIDTGSPIPLEKKFLNNEYDELIGRTLPVLPDRGSGGCLLKRHSPKMELLFLAGTILQRQYTDF